MTLAFETAVQFRVIFGVLTRPTFPSPFPSPSFVSLKTIRSSHKKGKYVGDIINGLLRRDYNSEIKKDRLGILIVRITRAKNRGNGVSVRCHPVAPTNLFLRPPVIPTAYKFIFSGRTCKG